MEYTNTKTEHSIKDSGKMISSTAMDMKNGWMEVLIWEATEMDLRMGWEFIDGVMAVTMKENGRLTRLMES